MSQRLGLRIDPLDVLFFRDNRPFNVGMRGVGDLPLPQTLAGALRTHVWRQLELNFEHLAERVRQELSAESDLTTVVAALLPAADAWAAYIKCVAHGLLLPKRIAPRHAPSSQCPLIWRQ
jgi:CRISPR-associated protein (Cas_Cmr3)